MGDGVGRIYLELNSECFGPVLEWLRARVIDPLVPFPKPPSGKEDFFKRVTDYLQFDLGVASNTRVGMPSPCMDKVHVVSVSSQGGALGWNPAAVFTDNMDQGWTSATSDRQPFMVFDLGEECMLRTVHVNFYSSIFVGIPAEVAIQDSASIEGPWRNAHQITGNVSFEVIMPGLDVCTRFLRLHTTKSDASPFVGVRRLRFM